METKVISFDKTSKCSHCGKDLNFKLYPIFNLQDLTENMGHNRKSVLVYYGVDIKK